MCIKYKFVFYLQNTNGRLLRNTALINKFKNYLNLK